MMRQLRKQLGELQAAPFHLKAQAAQAALHQAVQVLDLIVAEQAELRHKVSQLEERAGNVNRST